MRITNNMLINNMINYINSNLGRMEKLQRQMATGKKISMPSDDPVAAARALKLRTDVAEIEQYKRNVKDAQSWLDITENTLASIGEVLHRARELTVQGANGIQEEEDARKITAEIKQLRTQLIHLGNTTYAGRYIFSGFKTDKKLIDEETGKFAIDVNNSEMIKYEIGIGDDININVTGGDLFNAGKNAVANPSAETGELIRTFDDLIAALESRDQAAIDNCLERLDEGMNNVLRVRADVGARQNRLELTAARLENDNLNFIKLMSENEDIDLVEVLINLRSEENVYQASLAGGARIIMPTLVDFLR
ncbi:MAG TPA: flagellar hook-associated protein FlgL [Clostridiaceae bacterium]|nr:flagellar hook-associated protein FlgL [Clostridiaceae bacterium]